MRAWEQYLLLYPLIILVEVSLFIMFCYHLKGVFFSEWVQNRPLFFRNSLQGQPSFREPRMTEEGAQR